MEMNRTQIYLTAEEVEVLERVKAVTGMSVSELIRRAIDKEYLRRGPLSKAERLRVVEETAGAWKGRTETGAEYVERMRSGRLRRLYERRG